MYLVVFKSMTHQVTENEFVEFWSKLYDYPKEHYYQNNMTLTQFEPENIEELYVWKNGMALSGNKSSVLAKILSDTGIINELKLNWSETTFIATFGGISTIWQIFLMHVINPSRFPIFDQHVYRAYKYLHTRTISEIASYNPKKMANYTQEYLPFYYKFEEKANHYPSKIIDNALWAFGRFMKAYPHLFQYRFENCPTCVGN